MADKNWPSKPRIHDRLNDRTIWTGKAPDYEPEEPKHMPEADPKCAHEHTAPMLGRIWCVDCGGEVEA